MNLLSAVVNQHLSANFFLPQVSSSNEFLRSVRCVAAAEHPPSSVELVGAGDL